MAKREGKYCKLTHTVYQCNYHIVWTLKYRYRVLKVTCPQKTDPVLMSELCPTPNAQHHEKEKPHAAA